MKAAVAHRYAFCLALLITMLVQPGRADSVTTAPVEDRLLPAKIVFNDHIRPILTTQCTACHGGVKQAAGLSFVYGDQMPDLIDLEDPEESYLIDRVASNDDEYRMPPPEHGPPLPKRDVALLTRWIEQGGKWSDHWAYELPADPEAPEVADADWVREPLDRFVLSRLEEEGITPANDERPERWLRRVTLDLIGLPPTIEQQKAFLESLKQSGEEAYVQVVDRLLASPRFGERWASVWFDQMRYADSRGQGEDSPRDIWKYRDWVIDAINADMPYDQFTIKQLAGDLLKDRTLEDRLATAAHRLTQTNEEGGTDDEEFRVASVIDRLQTTWQTWQGVTIGCVQCHDHPYDPIQHHEFYQAAAYFNNTADVDLSDDWPLLEVPLDTNDYELATELDRRIHDLQESLWHDSWMITHKKTEWQPLRIEKARTSKRTKAVVEKKQDHDEYHTVGTVSNNLEIITESPLPETDGPMTGLRLTLLPLDPEKALPDAEVGFILSTLRVQVQGPDDEKPVEVKFAELVGDEPFPYRDPNESLDGEKWGFGAWTRVHHPRELVAILKEPLEIKSGSKLTVRAKYRVFDLAAFVMVARRGYFSISTDTSLTELSDDEARSERAKQLAGYKAGRDAIDSIPTPILRERPEHLKRPSHVFVRGLFLTKDKEVQPGVPASMYGGEEMPDRLAFANWLVSPKNPLTARVAVNRYWARMFGIGLVATEEDFGSAGEQPSHPELLDDLAIRFRDDYGWSVKKLLRELALSRTYRQSSKVRADLYQQDSQNRLLARGPRHSLPAEAIRDQMLSISGLLSTKMHGPPVHPPLPSGVWKARRGSWKTPKVGDPDRYRRSVYTYIKRSVPFPTFATFDAPSRDFCAPKRLRSNTPLQPLMLLNDSAFVECARALADLMTEHSDDLDQQIAYGFKRSACRGTTPDEIAQLVDLYEEAKQAANHDVAMQAVAGVLLNLDEIIMK